MRTRTHERVSTLRIAGLLLFATNLATALTVFGPMLIYGGVVNVEPSVTIRVIEFAMCAGAAGFGLWLALKKEGD